MREAVDISVPRRRMVAQLGAVLGEAKMRLCLTLAGAAVLALAASASALASETITYTYDTNGRVVQVTHTGTVNNNLQTTYTLDKADNRTNVSTSNASNGIWGAMVWGHGSWR